MILKAWGMLSLTPKEWSDALSYLKVSHSILEKDSETNTPKRYEVDFKVKGQKKWPVILDTLDYFDKIETVEPWDQLIVFVFCSRTELLNTNLTPLQPSKSQIIPTLKYSLLNLDSEPFKLEHYQPDFMQYVQIASKPSALSHLQTAYYKITPYSHRKVVQQAVTEYLLSLRSFKSVSSVLKTTLRGEQILEMLQTEECKGLRNAVKKVKKGACPVQVSKELGVDTFDINYLMSGVE